MQLFLPSTSTSASSWLDRLHSKTQKPNTNSQNDNPTNPTPENPLTTILCDLFALPGNNSTTSSAKSTRKQLHPHFLGPTPPPPKPRGDAIPAKSRKRRRGGGGGGVGGTAAARGEVESSGKGTRTEVTVIDTSIQGWKAAKVMFRRRGFWKVKDKKGGCVGGRRRKKKKKKKEVKLVGEDKDFDGNQVRMLFHEMKIIMQYRKCIVVCICSTINDT